MPIGTVVYVLARHHPPYRCRLLGIAPLTPGGLVCGYVPAIGQGSHALPASTNLPPPCNPSPRRAFPAL